MADLHDDALDEVRRELAELRSEVDELTRDREQFCSFVIDACGSIGQAAAKRLRQPDG